MHGGWPLKIWIDGDSWPRQALKTILNFIRNKNVDVEIVADTTRNFKNCNIRISFTEQGRDAVDKYILKMAHEGDIVLTMDFYLARELLQTGRIVINHKGQIWNRRKIENRITNSKIMYAMKKGKMVKRTKADYKVQYNVALENSLKHLV